MMPSSILNLLGTEKQYCEGHMPSWGVPRGVGHWGGVGRLLLPRPGGSRGLGWMVGDGVLALVRDLDRDPSCVFPLCPP